MSAYLFQFHTHEAYVRDRALRLRRRNRELYPIGQWGGQGPPPEWANEAFETLVPYAPPERPEGYAYGKLDLNLRWKSCSDFGPWCMWRHLTLAERDRIGTGLFILQYDILLTAPIVDAFNPIDERTLLLSGLRPLDEVRSRWFWTGKAWGGKMNADRLLDLELSLSVNAKWACVGPACFLPRPFLGLMGAYALDRIVDLLNDEVRLPMLATKWGFGVADAGTQAGWFDEQSTRYFHAKKTEIKSDAILEGHQTGRRAFHPVRRHETFNPFSVPPGSRLCASTGDGPPVA